MGKRVQPQPGQPLARLQRRLLTATDRSSSREGELAASRLETSRREVSRRDLARLVRAEARREDSPAPANSLLVEVSSPAEARAVVLRYSWDGGASRYELPLERLKTEGDSTIWSCLLLVPRESAEVDFCLALSMNGEEILLSDDGGKDYTAVFRAP